MSVIQVGDKVTIRYMESAPIFRNSNLIYKVESIPGNQNLDNPFWELSYAGDLFVVSSPLVLKLVDGAP